MLIEVQGKDEKVHLFSIQETGTDEDDLIESLGGKILLPFSIPREWRLRALSKVREGGNVRDGI